MDLDSHSGVVDVRGVGDSGWSNIRGQTPPSTSEFKKGLNDFDPTEKSLEATLTLSTGKQLL